MAPAFTKTLTYRQKDPEVSSLNQTLAFTGLSIPNPNSNFFNATTRARLRTFQLQHGLSRRDPEYRQGVVGPKTMAALNRYQAEINDAQINPQYHIPVYLRYGQRGGGAMALNATLKLLGYQKVYWTYTFNYQTLRALQAFQRSHGLKPTTRLNQATLEALQAAVRG